MEWVVVKLLGIAVLLCFSAFFSGSEASLFSLSKLKLKQIKSRQNRIKRLLKEPHKLLSSILIGNTLVNIIASALATTIFVDLFRKWGIEELWGVFASILIMTGFILFFGEIVPITIGTTKGKIFAPIVIPGIEFIMFILSPFRIILGGVSNFLVKTIETHKFFTKEAEFLTDEEIKTIVDLGQHEGVLQKHERKMIHNIFDFGQITVAEVMTPKEKMVCLHKDSLVVDVFKLIKAHGHSRIPIYVDNIDNIVGFCNAKDLLSYFSKIEQDKISKEIIPPALIRIPYFVLDKMKVNELLKIFQKKKIHLAIVKNEHQITTGLVSIEDLIEEIVGEIHDE